jgi:hypothetical protein
MKSVLVFAVASCPTSTTQGPSVLCSWVVASSLRLPALSGVRQAIIRRNGQQANGCNGHHRFAEERAQRFVRDERRRQFYGSGRTPTWAVDVVTAAGFGADNVDDDDNNNSGGSSSCCDDGSSSSSSSSFSKQLSG